MVWKGLKIFIWEEKVQSRYLNVGVPGCGGDLWPELREREIWPHSGPPPPP